MGKMALSRGYAPDASVTARPIARQWLDARERLATGQLEVLGSGARAAAVAGAPNGLLRPGVTGVSLRRPASVRGRGALIISQGEAL